MSVNNTNYGLNSLKNNNGNDNSAFGAYSLYNSNSTSNNTAVGSNSLFYNTIGVNNTAIGAGSISNNTTGSLNTAVGSSALEGAVGVSVGNQNVAVGAQGLYSNTGNLNTALGAYAGLANTSQGNNTFLGALTDLSSNNLAYTNCTALGYNAKIDASNQIVLGTSSEKVKIPGSYLGIGGVYNPASGFSLDVSGNVNVKRGNIDISGNGIIFPNGTQTQAYLGGGGGSQWIDASNGIYYSAGTVGIGNTTPTFSLDVTGNARFTQDCSINSLTIGLGGGNIATNTANGYQSLKNNTTGYQNTSIGYQALQANTTGINNTSIGYQGLASNTIGNDNTANGFQCLRANQTGSYNTAIGNGSLDSNSTGSNNTACGSSSLQSNFDGSYNTGIGEQSLNNTVSGAYNTAIGYQAGNGNTNQSNNTFLGAYTFVQSNITNSTAVGYGALINASNQIALGTSSEKVKIPGSYVSIGGGNSAYNPASGFTLEVFGTANIDGSCNATSFNVTSDYRIKENVLSLNDTYNVDNLRPVTYLNTKSCKQDIGLIAHELQEIYPELVTGEKDGEEIQSVNYIGLIPILIKEIQDLKKKLNSTF
jgi:hypothetical protein